MEIGMTELAKVMMPPITHGMLIAYSKASGDRNPIHIQPEIARVAGHEDVIAHGMWGMAVLARALTHALPQTALRHFKVRFLRAMHRGGVLVCTVYGSGSGEGGAQTYILEGTVDGELCMTGVAEVVVG